MCKSDDQTPNAARELATYRVDRLQELLDAIGTDNRFYAHKLQTANVPRRITRLEEFAAFPFTTKAELVQDQMLHPPFGTNLTFPLSRYTRYHQTSGTTGQPLRWLDTEDSWSWMVERWHKVLNAASVTSSDRVVFAFSFGPFIGFWLAFEAAARLGALCLPAGGLSSVARLHLILDTQATILCCTPTYALHLAETAAVERIALAGSQIRRIIVAGEAGGSIPATRARLESLWPGARVFDHHGMTETGPVTFECPLRPGCLHVMEDAYLAEVIDPVSGSTVAPGSQGELVLTNFGRLGSPLLRYRTGDLVKSEQRPKGLACSCGRPDLVLEGGILGRVDDMVIVRGVNVYPIALEEVVRSCEGLAEYQVRVSRRASLTELNLIIEPADGYDNVGALVSQVTSRLQHCFNLRISVKVAPRGSLPRFEMKAKRWVFES